MISVTGNPRHYPHPSSRPVGIAAQPPFPRRNHPHSPPLPHRSADLFHTLPVMIPRPPYPTFFSSGASGTSNTPAWMDPRHLAAALQTQHSYHPSPIGSSGPEPNAFSYYSYLQSTCQPQPYPYASSPPVADDANEHEDDNPAVKIDDSDASQSAFVKPPPRPPNAWIIYRSDMLRAIARGDPMPKLDAAMAESGISSGESPADEAKAESSKEAENGGTEGVKKKKPKKPKKGSKEPTAGMLSLGKGKTGRGIPQADVSKLISLMWAREEPEVKKMYEKQSAQHKKDHQIKYPDYKFQPLKRADKLRMREERDKQKAEAKKVQKQTDKQAGKHAVTGTRAKRKTRSRVAAQSPYAVAMTRTKSATTPSEVKVKDEPSYSMYPFPIPQDSLPSLQGTDLKEAPNKPPSESKQAQPAMPPPPPRSMYPAWADLPDLGPADAVPYIFEPIPLTGEELSMDLLQPLCEGTDADADADALAALWCSVEEEDVVPNSIWDTTSSEAMQMWSELGSYPQYPSNLELSSSIAEQIAQDWNASLPQTDASDLQPTFDPFGMIQIPYYDYSSLAADSGYQPAVQSPGASGPFFSTNQPLSPVDPWSLPSIPDATPFRAISSGSNRNLSSSSSSFASQYRGLPDHNVPRHVSSSAFPSSSSSVNDAAWTDRNISFSAFAAQAAGDQDGDDPLWESGCEGDGKKGADEVDHSPNPQVSPTLIQFPASAMSNTPEPPSNTNVKAGPPRTIRRARTVGASFADST